MVPAGQRELVVDEAVAGDRDDPPGRRLVDAQPGRRRPRGRARRGGAATRCRRRAAAGRGEPDQLVVGGVAVAPPHRHRAVRGAGGAGRAGWRRPTAGCRRCAARAAGSGRRRRPRRWPGVHRQHLACGNPGVGHLRPVRRVAQPLGDDQAGRSAGALVRLREAGGEVSHGRRARARGSRRTPRRRAPAGSRGRPRAAPPRAARASATSRGGPAPAAACGARAGRG